MPCQSASGPLQAAGELRYGRRLSRGDVAGLARGVAYIPCGAVPSLVLFGLAALDVISTQAAATIALWAACCWVI